MADDKPKEKTEMKAEPKAHGKEAAKAAPRAGGPTGAQPPSKKVDELTHKQQGMIGFRAEVVELIAKTGSCGEVRQVLCRVLDGRDKGRMIRRNVKGQIKKGDKLLLLDTEREAKQIRPKK